MQLLLPSRATTKSSAATACRNLRSPSLEHVAKPLPRNSTGPPVRLPSQALPRHLPQTLAPTTSKSIHTSNSSKSMTVHSLFARVPGRRRMCVAKADQRQESGPDVEDFQPNFGEVRGRFERLSLPSLIDVKKVHPSAQGQPATRLSPKLQHQEKVTNVAELVEARKTLNNNNELSSICAKGNGRVKNLVRMIDLSKGESLSTEGSPQFVTANMPAETPSPESCVASPHIPVVKTLPPPPLPPVGRFSINKAISKCSSLAVLSPSAFASPLLSGHGQRLFSRGSRRTSTPLEGAKPQGVDFGKPLGRQTSFINAMVLAEETEENAELYESCVGEKSTPKKNMVTFNSSVEEFSASSLTSRSSVGSEKKCEVAELAWPESPVKPVVISDDLYCDDDELFSPHMQLVGDEKSSLVQLIGDEKNSAEATTQTEDSSFLSGSESLLKKSSQGYEAVHHVAANREEAGFNSEDDSLDTNFLTGQVQQLSCEQQEGVNENVEGEQLGKECNGQNIVANTLEVALQYPEPY